MANCDNRNCVMDANRLAELIGEDGFEVAALCQTCHGWASDSRKLVVSDVGC